MYEAFSKGLVLGCKISLAVMISCVLILSIGGWFAWFVKSI